MNLHVETGYYRAKMPSAAVTSLLFETKNTTLQGFQLLLVAAAADEFALTVG
jgi:hypothetical protein